VDQRKDAKVARKTAKIGIVAGAILASTIPAWSATETLTACGPVYGSAVLGADLSTTTGDCLRVMMSGVTIDGGGHRISAPGFALSWVDRSNVTVRNVVSTSGVQIYGAKANANVVEDSVLGTVGIYMGDDNVVRRSTIASLKIQGLNQNPPLRTVIAGNTIEGPGQVLVYLSPEGDEQALCARSDARIENNYIHDTAPASSDADHVLLYLRCGTHNAVVGNTMVSEGKARGIYMRDEADDNLIQDNVVSIVYGDRSALHFSSGNTDKHHPRNNSIDHNVFQAKATRSLWIQSADFRDNSFTRNIFWSNSPTEGVRIFGGTGNVFDHNSFFNGPSTTTLFVFQSVAAPGNTYTNNILQSTGTSLFGFSGEFDARGYHADHNVFAWLGVDAYGAWVLSWWQQNTGQDAHSIAADPRFVSPLTGDFRLQPGSPALTADSDGGAAGASGAAP
jgi:parallel beta helix pectate lyase-like protein